MAAIKDEIIQKWETKVMNLAKETDYDFYFLWEIWMDLLTDSNQADETEEEKWKYFEGVTREHDW